MAKKFSEMSAKEKIQGFLGLLIILPLLFLIARCSFSGDKTEQAPQEAASVPKAARPKVLWDIKEIALKPRKQAELFVGKAKECEQIKYGLKCYYPTDTSNVEIVYINGVADWITLENPKFDYLSVPQQLGMEYESSTFMNSDTIRYENRFGFYSMSVFFSKAGVSYVYIKARTP